MLESTFVPETHNNIKTVRWLEMLMLHNRILKLPDNRWPEIIYNYDISQHRNTWESEVDHVCRMLHLPRPRDKVEYDLGFVNHAICAYR